MILNIIGYYSFLAIVRDKVVQATATKIQTNINEPGGNLILKLPLSLPYLVDSETYEATTGNFTFEGKVYQVIKQRLYRDTLYMACLHDYHTTEAEVKIDDYMQSLSGNPVEHRSEATLLSGFTKDFLSYYYDMESADKGWVKLSGYSDFISAFPCNVKLDIFHPPRLIS